jgi:hypothetical protein
LNIFIPFAKNIGNIRRQTRTRNFFSNHQFGVIEDMDTSKLAIITLPLFMFGSSCWAIPDYVDTYSYLDKIPEWQILAEEEMESTSGEFLQLGFVPTVAIAAGAIGNAGNNALKQYHGTGSVNLGEVAAAAALGGALVAVNLAAIATGSPVAIVTAAGLDIAVTVASAVGADFVGPPTPTPVVDLSKINVPPTFGIVYGPPIYQPAVIRISHGPDFGGGAGEEHYLYF